MPDLTHTVAKLHRAQGQFLRAADDVPADLWRVRPAYGGWSVGEIVAHLCQVERLVLGTADRLIHHPPQPVPFWKRFHVPMFVVEGRLVRRESPVPLDPALVAEKEPMLAELRRVRERSLAFLDETKSRDLSAYYWPHPFLGMLNAYAWFQVLAAHQVRHCKQMQEIISSLPKVVVNSQK